MKVINFITHRRCLSTGKIQKHRITAHLRLCWDGKLLKRDLEFMFAGTVEVRHD